MTEADRLRDLLHRAVPEAHDVDAGTTAAAGRRSRNRRIVAIAALATSACVIVATALVLAVPGDTSAPAPAAPDTYVDDRTQTVDAYGPTSCPTQLRTVRNTGLPDLADATSVRLCGPAVPHDALVVAFDSLAATVSDLPAYDETLCGGLDYVAVDHVIEARFDDRVVRTSVRFCDEVSVGGIAVDGGDVVSAFLGELDSQRDRYAYAQPDTEPRAPLTCRTDPTVAPVRPGRDGIESAISCPPYDSGRSASPVLPPGLERLGTAWAATPGPVETEYDETTEPCTLADDGWPFLVVRTRVGDVVRLAGTDCDRMVVDDTAVPGRHWEVPVALADITDES